MKSSEITELQKAEVLIEALPYIQRFNRKIIVVKYGGSAMVDEDLKKKVIQDVVLLKLVGFKPIIVHGGGKEISRWVGKVGMEPHFVNGLRVTDEPTMEIAEMVLNKVNKSLVQLVNELGIKAVGISGKDGMMLKCHKKLSKGGDIGFVGEVDEVDPQVIYDLLEKDFLPIVCPIGLDKNFDTYNINAACTVEDSGGNNIFYLNKTNATVTGSMGDDTFYVSGSTNNVLGSGGNDYFVVTGSNNIIDGGTGDDLYTDTGSGNTIQNMNYDPNNGTLNFTYLGEVKTFEINGAKYTITNDKNGNNTLTYSYNPNTGTIKLDGSALLIDGVMDVENKLDIYGSNNTINGGNKSDTITVQSGSNNIINAGAGNDTLTMNSENNSLLGESGDDKIILNASTNKLVDSQ